MAEFEEHLQPMKCFFHYFFVFDVKLLCVTIFLSSSTFEHQISVLSILALKSFHKNVIILSYLRSCKKKFFNIK
jgi:hypothetical protein